MTIIERIFQTKKVAFLDLDGTIYMGDALIPGAKEFLDYLKESGIFFYFLIKSPLKFLASQTRK